MIMVMLRMFFPCNFIFTKNIYSTRALTVICDILMKHIWKDYSVSDVIIVVWILISFMYICKLIHTQIQFNRFLSILVPDNSNEIEKVYKSVQNNKNYKLEIYKIQGIKSPCITGLIHPKILLPEMNFTEKELQYIFKHELQHFNHHDLWLNMLCEIIMCFYWWNPFAYFLKEKFKDMLEFANDKKITESMNEMEIYEYLECMLKIIKNNKMHKKIPVLCFIVSFVFAFEPEYNNPDHKPDEVIYNLENKDTFFIKNNKGYKIYYKGRFVGKCKSLETFQGYRVYKNDNEAKENVSEVHKELLKFANQYHVTIMKYEFLNEKELSIYTTNQQEVLNMKFPYTTWKINVYPFKDLKNVGYGNTFFIDHTTRAIEQKLEQGLSQYGIVKIYQCCIC